MHNHQPGVSTGGSYMAHRAFRVNLILVFTFRDYRGPIYMGSNVTPWVLQGFNMQLKRLIDVHQRTTTTTTTTTTTCVARPGNVVTRATVTDE